MKKKLFMVCITLAFINIGAQAQDVIINNEEEFKAFLEDSNDYSGKTVKLAKDLDFSNYAQNSIHGKTIFSGTFDGQGYTISSIQSDANGNHTDGNGLFRQLDGTISNLKVNDIKITTNLQNSGILVGIAKATAKINNCMIKNSSFIFSGAGAIRTGFLVGKLGASCQINDCYIENCNSTANNINFSPDKIGILIGSYWGQNKTTIKNCFIIGSSIDKIKESSSIGLILGGMDNPNADMLEIVNCYGCNKTSYNIPLSGYNASGNFSIVNSSLKDATFFENPESAWILNTTNATVANSKVWSHDGTKPVFADATHGATVKAGQINSTTQAYANGNNVLATDFNYIAFDTTNSEISDYSALEISSTNPNALIYLPADATLNKNNAVIGDQCANLVLTDGHDFVCPTAFTATNAKYTRNCYTDGGWETIVLPFAVEDIQSGSTSVKNDYTIEEYKETTGADNTKTIKFGTLTSWVAGKAYILKCNNATSGTQACTFLTNTSTAIAATPTDADFKGTYALVSHDNAKGNYILNSEGTAFNKIGTTEASIPAFRAYLQGTEPSKTIRYSVIHGEGGATNIEAQPTAATIYAADGAIIIQSDKAQTIHIYSIDGRKVQSLFAGEGTTTVNGLVRGIYMVNNQKVIVK